MPQNQGFFKTNRFIFLALIVVGVVGIAAKTIPGFQQFLFQQQQTKMSNGGEMPIGGPFHMIDQNGQVFTEANLLNKYTLLFFGYTHCPDVCPTSLAQMADVYSKLPTVAQKKLQVVFVTVDPQRDTPKLMKEYLANFNPNFIGLSGTAPELKSMAKEYLVYYAKNPDSDPEHYLMDHSAYYYLMGPDGKYVTHYSHKMQSPAMVQDIRTQMGL